MEISQSELYRRMALIRRFEETVLELYTQGKLGGTTHTCIGQEANAVGVVSTLDPSRDNVLSSHRNHGHYLAFTDDVDGLLQEIMGRQGGVCGGRGGSQHLHSGRFLSNGVQGGTAPVGTGMAMAEKRKRSNGVSVVFLGDGTLGQGAVYESLNMASLWSLPVLYVVENNRYAQTTPVDRAVAGSMTARAEAFGVMATEMDTTDVESIRATSLDLVDGIRATSRPAWLVLNTYRFSPHSKGDDFRSTAEIERFRAFDPLKVLGARLPDGVVSEAERQAIETMDEALQRAEASPHPEVPREWAREGTL